MGEKLVQSTTVVNRDIPEWASFHLADAIEATWKKKKKLLITGILKVLFSSFRLGEGLRNNLHMLQTVSLVMGESNSYLQV